MRDQLLQTYAQGAVTITCHSDHIVVVTLNRPEARNAINPDVTQRLDEIVQAIETDDDIWAVILTGAGGRVFSAGADLKEVADNGFGSLYTERGGFAGFSFVERRKIWIAAVEGFALAGGFELVLACDMVVAGESAQFGLPEVGVGLAAAAGGVYRLPRTLPRTLAIELIATTERLPAKRALASGLINRVVADGSVLEAAAQLAERICENAPLAVQESVALARKAFDMTDQELAKASIEAQARLSVTEDFSEGPRAFIEKRPPVWKGR
ncbi:enoyl-CoA hydratase [Kineobactrum sediminis]|uniref:Enoyl-CoA hydratase n=1 Tax=Kineobactrum sediminis TaxID=1905677 RepID=A0A2N5Y070_9GAMM|nr:enoyl-CoA hydratase-related protein [Kineobactrum sediminis]PLW81794.1 enoyl-CoA hydratase [Kineobactrum sediminis]